MLTRLISARWLLSTGLLVAVACTATGQDLTLGELLANMEEAERAVQDLSFKLIASQGPRSELGKMLPEALKQKGFSFPQKTEQTFFIKKRPYKMLMRFDGGRGLTTIEGDVLYSYAWTTQDQTVYKSRLSDGSGPAWPSPAGVLQIIHKLVDRKLPNTIEREEDDGVIFILTFGPYDSGPPLISRAMATLRTA